MRILIAVHHYPPRRIAGAELRAMRLARWLVAHGHRVRVVCVEDVLHSEKNSLEWQDDDHEGVPVRRIVYHRIPIAGISQEDYDWPELTALLDEMVASWQPELVHLISGYLMGLAPLRAAWFHNVPIVVTLTDFWFLCPTIQLLRYDGSLCWGPEPESCVRCMLTRGGTARWLQDRFPLTIDAYMRWSRCSLSSNVIREQIKAQKKRSRVLLEALCRVDAIVCITSHLASMYIKHGVPAEIVNVISYLPKFPTAEPAASQMEAPMPTDGQSIQFGYIGAVWPHKGVHLLIEAFRQLDAPQARLRIMGLIDSPSYEQRLRKLADGDDRIAFHGAYRNGDLPELVSDVDVIVVPSLWHENAPRTLVEAYDLGKPVIGAAVGGIQELVQNGVNGMLYEHDDPAALTACLERFAAQPSLVDKFRRMIPKLVVGDAENERVFDVYQRVLGSAR